MTQTFDADSERKLATLGEVREALQVLAGWYGAARPEALDALAGGLHEESPEPEHLATMLLTCKREWKGRYMPPIGTLLAWMRPAPAPGPDERKTEDPIAVLERARVVELDWRRRHAFRGDGYSERVATAKILRIEQAINERLRHRGQPERYIEGGAERWDGSL